MRLVVGANLVRFFFEGERMRSAERMGWDAMGFG